MRPTARTWLAAGASVAVVAAVLVPLAARLEVTPATADPLAERLAERTDGDVTVQRSPDGLVRFVGTDPGAPLDLGVASPPVAADTFVRALGPDGGGDGSRLEVVDREPRAAGGVAVRYQQVVDGIPVFGGQASVQVDGGGGVLSALTDLSTAVGAVATRPEVSRREAQATAVDATARATGAGAGTLTTSTGELWLYDAAVVGPPSPLGPRLTWRFEVTGDDPPVRHVVLIDAQQGATALEFSRLAHGLDRGVCDSANNPTLPEACSPPYTRAEGGPVHAVEEVNRAYDYAGDTYDFFSTVLGRDGIDGAGMTIESRVRYCPSVASCPYNNAFWNGEQLTFGQGYALADDVVAHELVHGVTEHTANLFYYYQSGAINESMSDVFGELVDLGNGAGNDTAGVRWRVGEDLPNGAIRHLADPTAAPYNDPDRMTSAKYSADAAFTDGGGVHTNSGVGNRAAALMTDGGTFNGHTVTGIGEQKTAKVFYEALTAMLTSGSDYADLGLALAQSCLNLVGVAGITPTDCTQVDAVVAATEMAAQPTTAGAAAPEAPVCDAGLAPQDLWTDDLDDPSSGKWSLSAVNLGAAGFYRWAYQSEVGLAYATSGHDGLWGSDVGATSDRRAAMTQSVALPPGSAPFLRFDHAFHFETSGATNYDGGVVEYSTDGGGSWSDAGALFAGTPANGYNGALVVGGTNPLAGRAAFVGRSHGYVSSRAALTSLAGQSVRFRFRLGEDASVNTGYGWFVDDVRIHTCEPIPAPAVEVTQVATPTTVVAGEAVDLELTVHNTGNVALTDIVVASSDAPACQQPVPDLAPDASHVVDCTHATVDPDDIGTWSSTATVTAAELSSGVDSNTVEVEVAAPAAAVGVELTRDRAQVTAGDPIDLHVTVHNTGNVDLTGLGVTTDPVVAACDGPVPDLAPDASHVVDCTYATLDPGDVGTWSAIATVDGDQVDPVASAAAEVAVLAPGTPAATVTATADETTVVAGEVISLHTTVANTGNVPLSGLALAHSAAASCDGVVPDLGPGDQLIVDCAYTTLDPDDVGVWSDTATLTADELPAAINGSPVGVQVDAPDPSASVTHEAGVATLDLGGSVALGVTVANTGNVKLTGVMVTAPDAPDCAGGPLTVGVGADVELTCDHVPDAVGAWTSTVTVTADQLAGPVASDPPVAVEVLDPIDPTATITSPTDGMLVNQGQVVPADFACTDEHSAVATCAATGPGDTDVADGAAIDTTTPGVHPFTVTATDSAGNTAEVTHTYTVALRRPDGRIRVGLTGTNVGDGRYHPAGGGQTRTTRSGPTTRVTHYVTIQNDGSHPEAFALQGQPSTTNYQVRYSAAGVDISTEARLGTHVTPVLAPGELRTIRVVVTVGARAPVGSRVNRLVTATSTSDPLRVDVVRFVVARR